MTKKEIIESGIKKINDILEMTDAERSKRWKIIYTVTNNIKNNFDPWDVQYFQLYEDAEYVMIYIDDHIQYVINATGYKPLYVLRMLMQVLSDKF